MYLPEDLLIEILICLPLISILRFRCVCKSWYNLLIDSKFLDSKLDYDIQNENLKLLVTKRKTVNFNYIHSTESKSLVFHNNEHGAVKIVLPFDEHRRDQGFLIVGTCNGLVCANQRGRYYIWNPCTAEYKQIISPFGSFFNKCCGFCYDSKIRDYKFVSFKCQGPSKDFSQVEIYSLGSDSWRTCNSFLPYGISARKPGVFLNGAFHWLAYQPQVLLSMDIEDGVFKEIPQPAQLIDIFHFKFVNVLRGYICLLCSVSKVSFEIWEMKDYGVRESWSRVFKIDQHEFVTMGIRSFHYSKRVVPLKNRKILLEIFDRRYFNGFDGATDVLRIHLDETKRRQRVGYEYMKDIYKMEAYVESLVSVKSLGMNKKLEYYGGIDAVKCCQLCNGQESPEHIVHGNY